MAQHDAEHLSRRTGRPPTPPELAFVGDARVGHLATVDARNRPSVVPVCFALLDGDDPAIVSVLDEKPKRVGDRQLARVRNILHQPEVMLVVDRYDEDWSRLVFVQLRGTASLLQPGAERHAVAIGALRHKYPQYRAMAIERREVIIIRDLRATSWRGDGESFQAPIVASGSGRADSDV
ncbi:MAG: nitroreductase [uncultured Thermomicrobiales bacterium]|uniref:Nitroreductase n=1 Tax=uncultured Thermomicrobiales bacterium TaxID=1645740 RepID=A0A6J4VE92_9BACT|nr:MAG: nitroreductase [uncultured Thermomicrobiales bacterium]